VGAAREAGRGDTTLEEPLDDARADEAGAAEDDHLALTDGGIAPGAGHAPRFVGDILGEAFAPGEDSGSLLCAGGGCTAFAEGLMEGLDRGAHAREPRVVASAEPHRGEEVSQHSTQAGAYVPAGAAEGDEEAVPKGEPGALALACQNVVDEVRLQAAVGSYRDEARALEVLAEAEGDLGCCVLPAQGAGPARVKYLSGRELERLQGTSFAFGELPAEGVHLGQGVGTLLEDDVPGCAQHPGVEAAGVELAERHAPRRLHVSEAPDVPSCDALLESEEGGVVAVVVVHAEGEAALSGEGGELAGLLRREREGLLDERPDPQLKEIPNDAGVGWRGGEDVSDVDVVVGEDGSASGDEGYSMEMCESLGGLDPGVYEGDDLDSGGVGEDFEVGAADSAAAHERDPGRASL